MTDAEQARKEGFIVDTHCYPWVAYKGSRFNPTTWKYIRTDRECEPCGTSTDFTNNILAIEVLTNSFDVSNSTDTSSSNDFSGSGGDFGGGGDTGGW